ncbi:MAG: redoxin family protein [Acidimicrobiales bacterium]
MNRRPYLLGLAALIVIAGLAVYVATRTDPTSVGGKRSVAVASDLPVLADSVPSIEGGKGWLDSAPLQASDLRGKVVLYDFWTYSCVNCVRTLPHLKALYDRYHPLGFEIIGIHSPEFQFEKDHGNVQRAVGELDVTWPVLLDDDMTVWRSFGNRYWPAEYLADKAGQVRSAHFGEGDYSQKEDEVRALLGVAASEPRADERPVGATPTAQQTPEIHFGTDFGAELFSATRPYAPGLATFTAPSDQASNTFALDGPWTIDGQSATASSASSRLTLRYQAGEVNIVLGLGAAPSGAGGDAVPVVVELDGEAVPSPSRPDGMSVDAEGRTVVAVGAHDLFRLVAGGPSGFHTLTLRPLASGVQAYAVTFGT